MSEFERHLPATLGDTAPSVKNMDGSGILDISSLQSTILPQSPETSPPLDLLLDFRKPNVINKAALETVGLRRFLELKIEQGEAFTSLNLAEHHIGDEGARVIRDVLSSATNSSLRRLSLIRVGLGAAGLADVGHAVAESRGIETISLGGVALGEGNEPFSEFWQCISRCGGIREVRISHSGLKSVMLPPLCVALGLKEFKLGHLNLAHNRLSGKDLMEDFGKALSANPWLHTLELSHNELGPKGAEALASGLSKANNSALRILRVDFNILEMRGCRAFARFWLQSNSGLELSRLDMRGNTLSDVACEELCRLFGKPLAMTLEFGSRQVLMPVRNAHRDPAEGYIIHRTGHPRYASEEKHAKACTGTWDIFPRR